jgi:type IV pilus assembly protein PilO
MDLKEISFKNLPRPVQHAVIAVFIVCMAGLFYVYVLKDRVQACDSLRGEIVRLETSVAKMKAVESQLELFKKQLAELEETLNTLRSRLPSQKETPAVLSSVQHMAVSSNLKILKFTPKPVVNREFYSDWPIYIEIQGNYNGLGTFFEKIGRATRLINVGTISIHDIAGSKNPKLTLKANCTATTFVYREQQPDAAGTQAPKK